MPACSFSQPQWLGEPAVGQTLLIHAEQGFGDTLQFCRFAPIAAARGLRIILEVQKPLVRLLRSLPDVEQVIAQGDTLPLFDLQCATMSMPLAMRTIMETIPAVGPGQANYLHADPIKVAAWQARLDADPGRRLKVGLVWAGNPALVAADQRRSLPTERLTVFKDISNVRLFSLQKNGPAAPDWLPLTDHMEEMADFADTAALIANLDLVISVDTAVAHLAGALGKPVWLLDRFDHCWRWLDGRRDSPWYPTLSIYRQATAGAWEEVMMKVAHDLSTLACSQAGKAQPGSPSSILMIL